MGFWIKHLAVAVVLMMLAGYLILNEGALLGSSGDNDAEATKRKPTSFAAAYERFRKAIYANAEEENKYVIKLDDQHLPIEQELEERHGRIEPMPRKWKGEVRDRRFRPGESLKTNLEKFADEEGLTLLWRLDQDYKIKHYFQVDSTFVNTLYKTAKAIDSDYELRVVAYFCPSERAAVIALEPAPYLTKFCVDASPRSGY